MSESGTTSDFLRFSEHCITFDLQMVAPIPVRCTGICLTYPFSEFKTPRSCVKVFSSQPPVCSCTSHIILSQHSFGLLSSSLLSISLKQASTTPQNGFGQGCMCSFLLSYVLVIAFLRHIILDDWTTYRIVGCVTF